MFWVVGACFTMLLSFDCHCTNATDCRKKLISDSPYIMTFHVMSYSYSPIPAPRIQHSTHSDVPSNISTCWCTSTWSTCVRYSRPVGTPAMPGGLAMNWGRRLPPADIPSMTTLQTLTYISIIHRYKESENVWAAAQLQSYRPTYSLPMYAQQPRKTAVRFIDCC